MWKKMSYVILSHVYENTFTFFVPFSARLASKIAKSAKSLKTLVLKNNSKGIKGRRILCLVEICKKRFKKPVAKIVRGHNFCYYI